MNTLVYLGYGRGPHLDEIVFSILTALHRARDRRAFEILVYTDVPEAFRHLPVAIDELDAARLTAWGGRHAYPHRAKVMAVLEALQARGGRVALVDGDTWFRRAPERLFARIAPGRSLLHLPEGRIASVEDGFGYAELAAFLAGATLADPRGCDLALSRDPMMWNSGVVGLHARDAALLPDALHLIDEIWSRFRAVHTIEQFALGQVLARGTRVATAEDVVFHYWMDVLRRPFRDRLPEVLARSEGRALEDRARHAYRHRPRPRLRRRCRLAVVHRLQDWGLMAHRMRASG